MVAYHKVAQRENGYRLDRRSGERIIRRGRMGSTDQQGRGVVLGIVLACILLAGRPCAFALNPELDVSQYAHTAWKIREGFTKGMILSIAQTSDGYLWLGTEFGLLRF